MNKVILAIGFGVVLGCFASLTIKLEPTNTVDNPYIQWSDNANPPVPGFEQHVDMYYSTHRDTIYMERSYGPNAE